MPAQQMVLPSAEEAAIERSLCDLFDADPSDGERFDHEAASCRVWIAALLKSPGCPEHVREGLLLSLGVPLAHVLPEFEGGSVGLPGLDFFGGAAVCDALVSGFEKVVLGGHGSGPVKGA